MLVFTLGSCSYLIFKVIEQKPPVEVETGERITFGYGGVIHFSSEKKDCKERGGVFRIYPSFTDYDYDVYSVECTKSYKEGNKDITETIFDYKI